MELSDVRRRITAAVDGLPLLDTHEHLMSEPARLGQSVDFFAWFVHYASSDAVSAGLTRAELVALGETERSVAERWAMLAPHWEHVRTTAYGQALRIAARDLYDVEEISGDTVEAISQRMAVANKPGLYEDVLKERAGIVISVLDPLADVDSTPLAEIDGRFFAPVLRVDGLTTPANRLDLLRLGEEHDVAIHTLDDLLQAMDAAYETAVAAGAVGIKVGVAYARPLQFAKVARADAERAFNRLSAYPATIYDTEARAPVSWDEVRPLHDYLMHAAVQRALEHGLPIQIHTGLQEGNGNRVTNSHPLLLVDLLMEYPEARFDLFHAGYPFQSEMATLGKSFPNAYLDMCWVYAISPWVARQTLHEWIETVPANKIFGFGGDYIFVEGAYAHARLARGSVARVLAEKVEDGYLSEGEAMGLAQKLLHDNAAAFFGL